MTENVKRVMYVTEYLDPPYDEGIRKTVYNLYLELNQNYILHTICRFGFKNETISIYNSNVFFLSRKYYKKINEFNPSIIIYFPFASGTFAGYLRLRVLKLFSPKCKFIFISLQNKPLRGWQKKVIKYLQPDIALTPSIDLIKFWDSINFKSQLLPLFTDINKFRPISSLTHKKILRKKYNLPEGALIITHMGHLNPTRNLLSLIPIQKSGYQIVISGSSSTPFDSRGPSSLKKQLISNGIIIFDGYIEKIEEIYQLSDLYIFPLITINASISLPLSVLEARACGIPVLTTNYASLKYFLGDDYGGIFYSEPEKFIDAIEDMKNFNQVDYTKTKIRELNNEFHSIICSQIEK